MISGPFSILTANHGISLIHLRIICIVYCIRHLIYLWMCSSFLDHYPSCYRNLCWGPPLFICKFFLIWLSHSSWSVQVWSHRIIIFSLIRFFLSLNSFKLKINRYWFTRFLLYLHFSCFTKSSSLTLRNLRS